MTLTLAWLTVTAFAVMTVTASWLWQRAAHRAAVLSSSLKASERMVAEWVAKADRQEELLGVQRQQLLELERLAVKNPALMREHIRRLITDLHE